ncbi:uncharacterized protein LTR77_000327 [Saxophila tyrrhenica]|uniref:F-box domain-containing protein n=1 Tax=Saxophila tyrrhenica TaxID=1690608 RepID=A0AAV9PS76_9PEZI|nr:hypothetical protein LTR77_000327 [Saxophila tyrrhenica]
MGTDAAEVIETLAATFLSTTAARSDPQECHLLKLPAELRLRIYDYYFQDVKLPALVIENDPLLATCRLIRREASEAMGKNSTMAVLLADPDHYDDKQMMAKHVGCVDWFPSRDRFLILVNTYQKPGNWRGLLRAVQLTDYKHLTLALNIKAWYGPTLAEFDALVDAFKKIRTRARIEVAMQIVYKEDDEDPVMAFRLRVLEGFVANRKIDDLVQHLGASRVQFDEDRINKEIFGNDQVRMMSW